MCVARVRIDNNHKNHLSNKIYSDQTRENAFVQSNRACVEILLENKLNPIICVEFANENDQISQKYICNLIRSMHAEAIKIAFSTRCTEELDESQLNNNNIHSHILFHYAPNGVFFCFVLL